MFHYTSCGLRRIWLVNGYNEIDTPYGKSVSIHDIEGLHRTIGKFLVENKKRFSGAEVRFLRKELDLSQSQLALLFGVGETTVRGWESNRTRITNPADRLLRSIYLEMIGGNVRVRELIERLSKMERIIQPKRCELEKTGQGWQKAA